MLTGLLAIVLVVLQVSSEQTFYWWDYTSHQRLLDEAEFAFRASPLRAPSTNWRSAGSDYSQSPTLLLLPLRFAFGDSCLVYILSVSLVYFVPFNLTLAAIATRLIPMAQPQQIQWTTNAGGNRLLNTVQQDNALPQPMALSLLIRTEGADHLLLTIKEGEDSQSYDRCSLNVTTD